jgi:amino acid adenylation domain-containing protein
MIYLLHQGVDESAGRDPQRDAMRFQGQALTYQQLAERSNQLAHFLRDQGIQRRDRVGVFLNKTLETVIAIYGIMKAGAAYVPLDPRSPITRLQTIIHDCEIRGIISQEDKAPILREVGQLNTPLQFVIGLSSTYEQYGFRLYDWNDVAQFPGASPPAVTLMEQDLAYIMYTSGSTGAPKGIMHTHYSGLSYARLSAATYGVTHQDVLSNHSPLHFDMSTFDYLTGPFCGATTIIIPEAFTLFPANLSKLIQDERMTIWYSVPFALIQLITRGVLENRDLSSLRWILYGGEPFPRGHLRTLMETLPAARISNVYGPAEVNQCTYYHLPPPSEWEDDDAPVPLGVIWDNSEGLVLDDDDQALGAGQMGELVVRTPTMMRGYWGRPDLNAKAFYRREVFPDYQDVFYRTGDLVQLRPDGLYDFFGRKDHQIKVRGYRVELAEVDHVLTGHEAVEEGAAYALRSEDGDTIEAAVILAAGASVTERELIAYLNGRLPHYAVPQRILFMESFPRTGTGKIDRRALRQMAMNPGVL